MHPSHELHEAHGRGPRGGASRGAWRSRARAACRPSRCGATPSERESARDRASPAVIEPDRDLLTGVDGRHRPRRVGGLRDAGPRALARLPVPARAAPADLRRPPARAHLAVLRVRLLAGPRRRVPALARRRRAARRAPVPAGPRAHVHRRPRPHRRQPRARRTSGSTRCSRRSASGPLTAFEVVAAVYGEALSQQNAHWLLSRDARLPDATCEALGRRASGSPASPSAGRHNQPMRIDEILAAGEPGLLLRVLPAEDRGGRANLYAALGELQAARARRSSRSPTAPAAPTRDKTIEIVKRIKRRVRPRGDGALHLRRARPCRELRETLDEMRERRASRTCSRCAATRRRARRSGPRPRAAWSTRASSSS